jgi:hypothetical protein
MEKKGVYRLRGRGFIELEDIVIAGKDQVTEISDDSTGADSEQ